VASWDSAAELSLRDVDVVATLLDRLLTEVGRTDHPDSSMEH
jgi:hypothetical protein